MIFFTNVIGSLRNGIIFKHKQNSVKAFSIILAIIFSLNFLYAQKKTPDSALNNDTLNSCSGIVTLNWELEDLNACKVRYFEVVRENNFWRKDRKIKLDDRFPIFCRKRFSVIDTLGLKGYYQYTVMAVNHEGKKKVVYKQTYLYTDLVDIAEEDFENISVRLKNYKEGTPITILLYNQENNKLLSRQEVLVKKNNLSDDESYEISLEPYLAMNIHIYRLVIVDNSKNRNEVKYFYR